MIIDIGDAKLAKNDYLVQKIDVVFEQFYM